jgi:site-specific recombinase XerD
MGRTGALARVAARAPGRSTALRHQRRHARPPLVIRRGSAELRRTAAAAGVRRRFAPHQLRHAHAVEMAREGVPLIVIQRQLGPSNLGITSVYLQGIDSGEIIETVHARRAPMIPVSASLRL